MPHPPQLGITVMPEWFQCEGIAAVLDRVQAGGATAIATSPYVLEVAADGEGAREPPPDGDAGRVRPLDRALFGRTELWVRTAPAFEHDRARYRGLRYQPSPPSALTARHARLLDDVLDAARARGLAVYLQVMAASPPGYRVQFSSAVDADQCLGPDGLPHPARVDRNATLASAEVVGYTAALVAELAERYPAAAGFRLDWPEYPPYDLKSALFDFNPAVTALMSRAGHDPQEVAQGVRAWLIRIRDAAVASANDSAFDAGAAIDAAGWNELYADTSALAALFSAKRQAARALLVAVRSALDRVHGDRRLLEPQAFPPPFHAISGFPLGELAGTADRIGIKLYTMHWPMLARYWARDLIGSDNPAALDSLASVIALRLGLIDDLKTGTHLHYPEPHEAHQAGVEAQATKLRMARTIAGHVPITAFVHSYGPVADFLARYRIAAATGLPLWINRYGYLSEAKLAALAGARG